MKEVKKSIRWRIIPYTKGFYQISEYGDVRVIKNACKTYSINTLSNDKYELVEPHYKKKVYKEEELGIAYVKIKLADDTEDMEVGRLMYEAFHGIYNVEHYHLLHLDGNEKNNSLENLIFCTKDDKINFIKNLLSSASRLKFPNVSLYGDRFFSETKRNLGISEYSLHGIRTNLYANLNQLASASELNIHLLKKCVSAENYLSLDGRIFKMGIGPLYIDTHLIRDKKIIFPDSATSNKEKKIFQYNSKGELVAIYNNVAEAAVSSKFSVSALKAYLKAKGMNYGYIWLHE